MRITVNTDILRADVRLWYRWIRSEDGASTEWARIDTDGHGWRPPADSGEWSIWTIGVLLRPGLPPVINDDFGSDLGEYHPDPMSIN